jgi:hypothetical protein
MSSRTACIRSAWRRGGTRLAVSAFLAVAALELGGCTWTEEEWQALANPVLCGVAFNCGGNGNSRMGNPPVSDSDNSVDSDDNSGNGSTGEAAARAAR